MYLALAVSVLLGAICGIGASLAEYRYLNSDEALENALHMTNVLSGAGAGFFAGCFTIWSKKRLRSWHQEFPRAMATFLFGAMFYWSLKEVSSYGEKQYWYYSNLQNSIRFGRPVEWEWNSTVHFVLFEYLPKAWSYVLLLIPFTFLSRAVVWRIYRFQKAVRSAETGGE